MNLPIIRIIHPEIRADDDSPTITFVASDETIDRYGEIITASGWDLANYRKNPVFLNSHRYEDVAHVLGRSVSIALQDGKLVNTVHFAVEANPVARIAFALYRGKFLNAVSVGFSPIEWEDPDGDHAQDAGARRRYTRQELLEVSAVVIPANPNAVALGYHAGLIRASDIEQAMDLYRFLMPSSPPGTSVPSSISSPASQDRRDQVPPAAAPDNSGDVWKGLLERAHRIMRGH